MKKSYKILCYISLLLSVVGVILLSSKSKEESKAIKPYKIENNRIVCHTPDRPAGQKDMLQFAAEPLDTVRVGFIGLGSRGKGGPKRWSQIDGTKIVALCDLKQECIIQCLRVRSEVSMIFHNSSIVKAAGTSTATCLPHSIA